MKNIHSLVLILIFFISIVFTSLPSYAQARFEPGYFISNANEKVTCLINNKEWFGNPDKFEYKLTTDGETRVARVEEVKEMVITGKTRYVSALVNIDISSDKDQFLSYERAPQFQLKRLFLEMIVPGMASLFLYRDDGIERYFYQTPKDSIKQLVYKRFYPSVNGPLGGTDQYQIAKNELFKQQLFNDVSCPQATVKDFQHIRYKQNDLERIFKKYNACNNDTTATTTITRRKAEYNLTLRVGLNMITFKGNMYSGGLSYNFPGASEFRLGAELEYVIPFQHNVLSLLLEPSYYRFKRTAETSGYLLPGYALVADYKALELTGGVRYSIYIKEKSRFFFNLGYSSGLMNNSSHVSVIRPDGSTLGKVGINTQARIAFGGGFNVSGKVSVEMRYSQGRLLTNSEYKQTIIIIGFSLF